MIHEYELSVNRTNLEAKRGGGFFTHNQIVIRDGKVLMIIFILFDRAYIAAISGAISRAAASNSRLSASLVLLISCTLDLSCVPWEQVLERVAEQSAVKNEVC